MTPITVTLYGEAGVKFPAVWKLAVKNAAEAARAIECNVGGFFKYLNDCHERGDAWQVVVDGKPVAPDRLLDPVGSKSEIAFVPVIQGAKDNGGLLNIVLGVVIIAAATILSQGTLTAAAISATFGAGGLAGFSASFGLAMALGGVSTMLAGKAKTDQLREPNASNQPSYLFNGPTNRVQQGNVYPVLYGTMIVGSQVISAGISSEDYVPPETGESGGGGGDFDPNSGDYGGFEEQP